MLLECIKNRRSIRKYKPTPVTDEQVQIMLEAAMFSPSACNTRAWRFIAITNREVLDKLADIHPWAQMLRTAPLCIVVVALPKKQEGILDGLPLGFFPQDCGAATQNILLQAVEMGLGSCWCGVYPKQPLMEKVSEILELSADEPPFSLIAVGEPDEAPRLRGKYEEEKVSWVR